jgi:hypothetical protein
MIGGIGEIVSHFSHKEKSLERNQYSAPMLGDITKKYVAPRRLKACDKASGSVSRI